VDIKIVRRRDRTKGAARSKELYACKYYTVSEVGGQQKISAPKYIFREWQMLRRIDHPNILRYEDFAYGPDGSLRVAKLYTEYCPIGDLSQFEIRNTPRDKHLSPPEVAQVFHQLAQALLYLQYGIYKSGPILEPAKAVRTVEYELGSPSDTWLAIIHRDIKPQNGMLFCDCEHRNVVLNDAAVFIKSRYQGRITVKLGDFGIATHDSDGRTQTYVGTNSYLAPVSRLLVRFAHRPDILITLTTGATLQ
jgi:serine/threonine protein kinase